MGKSGPPSPLFLGDTSDLSEPSLLFDPDREALRRLVSRAVPQHELPSVIGAVVSNVKATDIIRCLQGSNAQTFIDVMDEACHRTVLTAGELIH